MEIPINRNKPLIMHVDLNSCFATIEQQANYLLRGKPLVVAAYDSPNGCIVAPSIEAKKYGIKTGMRIREGRLLCPDIIVRTPDPGKYRDVHSKFKKIFQDYSPEVYPKSIDEAVIDFTPVQNLHPDLIRIAQEIKYRIKKEIGDWIICSIGISTNMFLAKLAASLHKPDGLDVIDYKNVLKVYERVQLLDLNGINVKFQARLNMNGIYTPIDFFNASSDILYYRVFKSILGRRWYEKLRGYEADQKEYPTRSIGQMYSLQIATSDKRELSRLLMKLCEKAGRRLRKQGKMAAGVHVWCLYKDWTDWHQGRLIGEELYTTWELYRKVQLIFNRQPEQKKIAKIAISYYDLRPCQKLQMNLFEVEPSKEHKAALAMDEINDKFGEFTIVPGIMLDMDDLILDRIAFGGVKELEDLYAKGI